MYTQEVTLVASYVLEYVVHAFAVVADDVIALLLLLLVLMLLLLLCYS
jgi:hypothetical protein